MRLIQRGAPDEKRAGEIARDHKIGYTAALLLTARGVRSDEDVRRFLSPSLEHLCDPFLFENMGRVCTKIREAAAGGQRAVIFSDYDADGVCGAAVLSRLMEELGIEYRVYIPSRHEEGYGMNVPAVKRIAAEGGSLLISVDCGITNVAETRAARAAGMDVIILDHHECGAELPDTPYILNAKRPGEPYPFRHLCGAGVAFKLACAMTGRNDAFLEIAAVATIGDIVSLTGENRAIAAEGMKRLREGSHPGVSALAEKSMLQLSELSSTDVAFQIVPRLNAAGRLGSAVPAYRLMFTEDAVEASRCAEELCEINFRRKYMQRDVILRAAELAKQYPLWDTRALLLSCGDFEQGVVGIAASAIVERFQRPAIIVGENDGMCVGSARSLPGVNIYEALSTGREHMVKFGGHAMAAGFSCRKEELESVRAKLEQHMRSLPEELFLRSYEYDAKLSPKDITPSLIEDIGRLEPFGEGNPSPVFVIDGVTARDQRRIGKTGDHLFFRAAANGAAVNTVKFGTNETAEGFSGSILGELHINDYDGKPQIIAEKLIAADGGISAAGDGKEYMRVFISEVRSLAAMLDVPVPNVMGEREFLERLEDAFRSSALGTAFVVNSRPGMETALALGIEQWPEAFRSFPEDTAENCFCGTARGAASAVNFRQVFACGAFSLGGSGVLRLWSEGLLRAYGREAKRFAIRKRDLPVILKAADSVCRRSTGFDAMSRFLAQVGRAAPEFGQEQLWLAVNIFSDLKLIEIKKDDRIHIKIGRGYLSPEESPSYRAFVKLSEALGRLGRQ